MVKHYVEFFYANEIFSESTDQEVIERKDSLVQLPDGACGYRFYDQLKITERKEEALGDKFNYSPFRFFGLSLSAKQIRKALGRKSNFYQFMKKKGYKRAVLTKHGGDFVLVEDEDIIIED